MEDDNVSQSELSFSIKVMNNLTGEISEIEVKSATQAASLRQELKASKSAIEKALKVIDARLDTWLGTYEESVLPNGMKVKRVHRVRTEWQLADLRKYLDEDQISLITTVKKTDAKNMLAELAEHGHVPNNAIKLIEENAIHLPSSPFIEVR